MIGETDRQDTEVIEVIESIAETEGVEPVSLTPPLQSVIDVDALETLVSSSREGDGGNELRVEFRYLDHEVVVKCGEEVDIEVNGTTHG